MLLIPIGRDDAEIRRHAWISYSIIALNVLVFAITMTAERESKMAAIDLEWRNAIVFNVRHPYLQTPPGMAEILRDDIVRYLQYRRSISTPPAAVVLAREQR